MGVLKFYLNPLTFDDKKGDEIQKRKDCFDRDKLLASRSYSKDDIELLKKITKKYRPPCHFCEGICGIMWYEFK